MTDTHSKNVFISATVASSAIATLWSGTTFASQKSSAQQLYTATDVRGERLRAGVLKLFDITSGYGETNRNKTKREKQRIIKAVV